MSPRVPPGQRSTDRDAGQASSDLDQAASEADQKTADRDQAASEADQRASDLEQAASDLDSPPSSAQGRRAYEHARIVREEGRMARMATTALRFQSGTGRDERASGRDVVARERDELADLRDREAESADREQAEKSGLGDNPALRVAARDRGVAARDRGVAARDRGVAASNRELKMSEIDRTLVDEPSGAYGQRIGAVLLSHEITRTRGIGGMLTLGVVELAEVRQGENSSSGSSADATPGRLLFLALQKRLRSFDSIFRLSESEFVCVLTEEAPVDAGNRLEQACSDLAEGHPWVSTRAGLATLEDDDTVESLVERARSAC